MVQSNPLDSLVYHRKTFSKRVDEGGRGKGERKVEVKIVMVGRESKRRRMWVA